MKLHGATAITIATQAVTVMHLVQSGASLDQQDEDGCTALMRATGRRHINVALYLIRNGANVTLKDNRGATAANIASAMGLTTIIEVCM